MDRTPVYTKNDIESAITVAREGAKEKDKVSIQLTCAPNKGAKLTKAVPQMGVDKLCAVIKSLYAIGGVHRWRPKKISRMRRLCYHG